jgi:hypothetical protein
VHKIIITNFRLDLYWGVNSDLPILCVQARVLAALFLNVCSSMNVFSSLIVSSIMNESSDLNLSSILNVP